MISAGSVLIPWNVFRFRPTTPVTSVPQVACWHTARGKWASLLRGQVLGLA